MRILFVMHMPPPVHGASIIGQFIHNSEHVNESFECQYVNMTTAKSLEDIGKGGFTKYRVFFGMLNEIRRSINNFRPDVIYVTPNSANAPFYKDFFVVEIIKALKNKNTKLVMHFHNKGVKTCQDKKMDNLMYKFFFHNSKLILLDKNLYDDVKKYVKRENVHICANGIPGIQRSDNDFIKKENKIPHILWLSNIMRTKGIMEYLDALRILHNRGVKFQADFVGGPTMEMSIEEFLSELTLRGIDDCSDYLGVKFGVGKIECYKNSDIFVLPSYTEAFPLTILEAMSCGIPVVASNVGGVASEVVDGETGLLIGGKEPIMRNDFTPDPEELADKLEILIKDETLRKKMGNAAAKRFVEKFTLNVFEKNLVETLKQV